MEVIAKNFDELYSEVEKAIEGSIFVAIDTELSGLYVTDEKENCFETMEERYLAVRKSASQFLVVQFGLCAFFYDKEKDEFSHKAYNFFTFPRQFSNNAPNIRFLCESSSLDFLASCGFDFNKLIYEGIPYLTYSNEDKMKEDFEKRQAYLNSEENSSPLPVPENLKKFMDATMSKIKRFLASQLTEIKIENVSTFQRKLIFHNIKPKYSNKLYFETVVVSEESGEQCDDNESSSGEKSDSESKEITSTKTSSTNGKSDKETLGKDTDTKTKASRGDHKTRVLRIVKLSENEQNARDDEKKQEELDTILKGVGFSKVIRKISESGKLVVGHNMLLDVSHVIHQFIDDLPDNLADYKNMVQSTFPNLIDTKHMAATNPFKEFIPSSVLFEVAKSVKEQPFGIPEIKKSSEENAVGYDFDDKKKHEAGFDAFITGVSFIGMCQYLGTKQVPPKQERVLPDSPIVMPFLNKLYMMRMSDITYLNISGIDLTPSRQHVFYVTCPKDATAKSIQQIFQPFGTIQIWWRNQQSLFVALNDKDQSSLVMDNIECSADYRIIPFSNYQKQQREEKKRPLYEGSPERAGDILKKLVTDKSPPPVEHKKKRPKTDVRLKTPFNRNPFEEPTHWN